MIPKWTTEKTNITNCYIDMYKWDWKPIQYFNIPTPSIDFYNTGTYFPTDPTLVTFIVAGVSKEEIEITYNNTVYTIIAKNDTYNYFFAFTNKNELVKTTLKNGILSFHFRDSSNKIDGKIKIDDE